MSSDIGYIQIKISELQDKNKELERKIDSLTFSIEKKEQENKVISNNVQDIKIALQKVADIELFKKQIILDVKKSINEVMIPATRKYVNSQLDESFKDYLKKIMESYLSTNKILVEKQFNAFEKIQLERYHGIIDMIREISLKSGIELNIKKKNSFYEVK